jgi:hypothetical protein
MMRMSDVSSNKGDLYTAADRVHEAQRPPSRRAAMSKQFSAQGDLKLQCAGSHRSRIQNYSVRGRCTEPCEVCIVTY